MWEYLRAPWYDIYPYLPLVTRQRGWRTSKFWSIFILWSLYACLHLNETEKTSSRDYSLKRLNRSRWYISRKKGWFCPRTSSYFLLTQLHFTWALKRGSCLILSLPVSRCSEEVCISHSLVSFESTVMGPYKRRVDVQFSCHSVRQRKLVLTATCPTFLLARVWPSLHSPLAGSDHTCSLYIA